MVPRLISKYQSHPDKLLSKHIHGVMSGVKERTNLSIASIAALFHDLGKLNPNFQKKLKGNRPAGYSSHAYLSALAWLCFCKENPKYLQSIVGSKQESILSIAAIVAHHHGNLPDLGEGIFKEREVAHLKSFLSKRSELFISEYLSEIETDKQHTPFSVYQSDLIIDNVLKARLLEQRIQDPLDFYLETQFAFASLIAADKADASSYAVSQRVSEFCALFEARLRSYINQFKDDTELNKVRSAVRKESVATLRSQLPLGNRIFALTAPTGSGKTMMLLSLANEIVKEKGTFRIIYSLPFLSITEQVESICLKIFGDDIRRIDSKAENGKFQENQKQLDYDPEAIKQIIDNQFAEDTFDFPFIITTFVRFFETLVSNKNATLLKLPNFGRSIFLIDEIQSLPPRLYGFFVALLDAFCRKFDSYAIISTATMPDFRLPEGDASTIQLFKSYQAPIELLSYQYFDLQQFNRYQLRRLPGKMTIEQLADQIQKETKATLVILNTIDDTKALFKILSDATTQNDSKMVRKLKSHGYSCNNLLLLNTHCTPNDRLMKLEIARRALRRNLRFVVISTQLIEAGVDIDFPVVYRDWAPLPSIVQSAGRCNRNGSRPLKGQFVLIELEREGKSRWQLIYRGKDTQFVGRSIETLGDTDKEEIDLFEAQRHFFESLHNDLLFGYHQGKLFQPNGEIYFVERIKQAAFNEIGKFRLIDDKEFGEELRYYVPEDASDDYFEHLLEMWKVLIGIPPKDFEKRRLAQIALESQLKKMSRQVIQLRLRKDDSKPISQAEPCCGILKLALDAYCKMTGIKLDSSNQII